MTTPSVRLAPSGPPIESASIVVGGFGPFAIRYRHSGDNTTYEAPDATIGDPFQSDVASSPVTPDRALLSIDLPTFDPPAGFRWALHSKFTGCFRAADLGEAVDTVVAFRIEYQNGDDEWVPLSTSGGSGTAFVTAPRAENYTAAVHAIGDLTELELDEDATDVTIRVGWGMLGGEEATTARMLSSNEDQEGATGGWDWSSCWTLRPTGQSEPT